MMVAQRFDRVISPKPYNSFSALKMLRREKEVFVSLQDKADALEKVREARFEYNYTKKNALADVKREVELRTKAATTALSHALQAARKQGVEWKYLFEAMGTKDFRTVDKFLKFAEPIPESAQEPEGASKTRTETPLPMEILPDGKLLVADKFEFEVGGGFPLNHSAYEFYGFKTVKENRDVVNKFINTGVIP